jgi:predicted  nucleic acid-binding Zn-ribbon protein
MSREKIAVTVSAKNKDWLDENYDNRSAVIDDLLTRARKGEGEIDRAVARYQREQLEREKATLQTQMKSVDAQLKTIEKRLERSDIEKEANLDKARAVVESADNPTPTNPAVKAQADKLGMTPQQLLDELAVDAGDV